MESLPGPQGPEQKTYVRLESVSQEPEQLTYVCMQPPPVGAAGGDSNEPATYVSLDLPQSDQGAGETRFQMDVSEIEFIVEEKEAEEAPAAGSSMSASTIEPPSTVVTGEAIIELFKEHLPSCSFLL